MLRFVLKEGRSAIGVAVLGFQSPAAAQVDELSALPSDKVRIDYRAPAECPDVEAFTALVGSRAQAGWQAAPEQLARRVAVEVSGTEGQYAATVEFVDERGERVAQTLSGAVCSNVVDGIALVTALAIQSRATEAQDGVEPMVVPAPAVTEPAPTASEPTSAGADSAARNSRCAAGSHGPRSAIVCQPARHRARRAHDRRRTERRSGRGTRDCVRAPGRPARSRTPGIPDRSRRSPRCTGSVRAHERAGRGLPVRADAGGLGLDRAVPIRRVRCRDGPGVRGSAGRHPRDRGSAPWYTAGAAGRAVGRFGSFVVELEAVLGVPLRRERFHIERDSRATRRACMALEPAQCSRKNPDRFGAQRR